jgi:hypothetical protein
MMIPIQDACRPLQDAFPKSFDPLKTPGLILPDRPSRFAQQNLSRIGLN